jgi:hypothetical protein
VNADRPLSREPASAPGRRITPEEIRLLRARLGALVPEWLLELLAEQPLSGSEVTLAPDQDASGLGVEMRWMSPREMVSEATEAYPGPAARDRGLLPVGTCLLGSGDPYFVAAGESTDPALVRVPHDAVQSDGSLDVTQVERVADHLSVLLGRSARQ